MSIGDGARPNEVRQHIDAGDGMSAAPPCTVTPAATPPPPELRELAGTTVTSLVARVLGRQRDTWRSAIEAATSALADLERACDRVSAWDPAEARSEVTDLVTAIVAAADAERDAAIERARADAHARIDALQQQLTRLEDESAELRHKLGRAVAAQQEELALRLRAEAVGTEFKRVQEQMVARYESQLQAARLQAESEHLQFESLRQQLIVSLTRALRDIQPDDVAAISEHRALPSSGTPAVAVEAAPAAPSPIQAHGLKLVTHAPPSPPVASPEALDHLAHLLAEAEAAYQADIAAHVPPLETVDRLTENLRAARERFSAHTADPLDAPALFKEQLTALVNARADSSFGRHLGISLYALYPVIDGARESVRMAS